MDGVTPVVVHEYPKQSLADFIAEERQRLDAFEAQWKAAHAVNPRDFPDQLDGGTWFEALQTFDEESADFAAIAREQLEKDPVGR